MENREIEELIGEIHFLNCILQEVKEEFLKEFLSKYETK